MKEKIINFQQLIEEILNRKDFTDLEQKTVSELITEISTYHEELYFQNKELERIKLELEQQSAELVDLFNNVPIAYVVFDENEKIIKANYKFAEYLKIELSEVIGKNISEFISEQSQDDFYLYIKHLQSSTKPESIVIELKSDIDKIFVKTNISIFQIKKTNFFRAAFTDISELISLQISLQESQNYYQKILDNSPYGALAFTLDDYGNLIFNNYNKAANEIFNLNHNEFIGKKIEDIYPNLKNTTLLKSYKEVARSGGVFKIENYKYFDQKISGYYNIIAYQPIKNNLVVLFWDSSSEIIRQTLQEIEKNISISLLNLDDLCTLMEKVRDELSKIIDTSNMRLELYNKEDETYEDFCQLNQFDTIKQWSAAQSLSHTVYQHRKAVHFTKEEIEELIKNNLIKWRTIVPESWIGIPLFSNEEYLGIIIFENYTEKFKINNELLDNLQTIANYISSFIQKSQLNQFSNLLYRAFFNSPVSIVITDPMGYIQYANPAVEILTGYKFDEIKGKKTSIFRSGHHSVEFYQELWETILSGKFWEGKFLNRKKDGSLFWEEARISPVLDKNGQITHFIAVKVDITRREQLFAELQIAKEKAEESEKLKSAFLANMSHEIRTPLNAILGFSNILTEEDLTPEEKLLYCKIINEKGNELLKLIEDILDLSKLEANQLKIFPSFIGIDYLFQELEQTYKQTLKTLNKNIDLVFINNFPPDIQIVSDSLRLRQILDNLINNAIKFTEEGKIEVKCEPMDGLVKFSVSDTGVGIDPKYMENIFERFRQGELDFATRKYGGVGLGLPIVKGLVDLLGGKIWVESELNKGTTFTFTIKTDITK